MFLCVCFCLKVTGAIADSYSALVSKKRIVGKSLERAEALLADHEEFEVSIEVMRMCHGYCCFK